MPLLRRKSAGFDLRIEDMVLRVAAPEERYEESRAAALSFWEQIQSYSRRNPRFRTSKRPIPTPEDGPEICREMTATAAAAGVGPAFTFQGALIEHVGRFLAGSLPEVTVSGGGDHFVLTGKRLKFPVFTDSEGGGLSVFISPDSGVHGIYTTIGRRTLPAETVDGLAILAETCILADAAAAAVMAILARDDAFKDALAYLQELDGVAGGVVVRGERIGVVGTIELAA
jgi:ApbE superfamily uncharacterized protein (UPF0280 family)